MSYNFINKNSEEIIDLITNLGYTEVDTNPKKLLTIYYSYGYSDLNIKKFYKGGEYKYGYFFYCIKINGIETSSKYFETLESLTYILCKPNI